MTSPFFDGETAAGAGTAQADWRLQGPTDPGRLGAEQPCNICGELVGGLAHL